MAAQARAPRPITGFRFTNNAAPHRLYGINGGGASTGTLTLQMYFPGGVVTGNWLSGGNPAKYPAGNRFELPFDVQLSTIAGGGTRPPGADYASLSPLLQNIPRGLFVVPGTPKGLVVVTSSAKRP